MTSLLRYFCIGVIFLSFSTHCFSTPEKESLAPDTVSMSFDDYKKLRDKAKDPEKIRNSLFSYERAVIEGKSYIKKNKYIINFNANVYVTSYENRDILVPFLSSGLNLESLTVNGKQSTWVKDRDFYKVYIKGWGAHKVSAKFTVTLNAKIWPRNLYMPLVKIPGSKIVIKVPDKNIEAFFDKGVVFDSDVTETGDIITGYVPAVTGVNIKWLKKNTMKKKNPLKMNATIHSYASLEEKGAYCESEITFRILKGETNFFKIIVPNSVDILDVKSSDSGKPVSQWFTEKTPEGMVVNVFSSYKQDTSFGVRISYEKTEVKSGYIFEMPHLKPESVERFENLIAVGSGSNVEIGEDKGDKIERRDVRFLPAEIQKFAKTNALFYYKALAEDFALSFNVKSHENAQVLTMRIDSVEIDSVITKEGTVMTKIKYRIKNNQEQYLKIKLPESSKMLSVFLSGKEVQPAISGNAYLIPVSKSAEKAFPVEIALLTNKKAFGSFGFYSVYFPLDNLPVGELTWRLYTPLDYQPIYFGGNIERKVYGLSTRLSWLLSQLEENPGNLAYAGGSYSQNYEYNTKGVRKRFKKKFMVDDQFESEFISNQIRVSIPVVGNRYSFSSYLVSNFSPEIKFFYINESVKNFIAFLVSAFMFIFVSYTLIFILERKSIPEFLVNKRVCLILLCMAVFVIILLATFSFGINSSILNSIIVSIIVFSIFQNRQVSKRFHENTKSILKYLPEVFLVFLLLIILFSEGFRLTAGCAALCLLSIIFHALFQTIYNIISKIILKFTSFFKSKKTVNKTASIIF